MTSAIILDVDGTSVTAEERAFLKDIDPYGFILFARNIETPVQVRKLTDEFREITGRQDLPILVDQEGGRVARFQPPHWRKIPSAAALLKAGGSLDKIRDLVYLNARLLAEELAQVGVTVNCAPVADIPAPDADPIIGDRAYGTDPQHVAVLAAEVARGLTDGGILPIAKHIPGHGRATADSHLTLPVVDTPLHELQQTDFVPFRALKHLPYAMTAHIVYSAIDPQQPATFSRKVIDVIRKDIGFEGLIMSDAIDMQALSGAYDERARKTLAAGCDLVLLCNSGLEVQHKAMAGVSSISGNVKTQTMQAFANLQPKDYDRDYALNLLNAVA